MNSLYLTGLDFDKFAMRNREWLFQAVGQFDPATSIKKFFQEQLFERRNQIVHYGYLDFEKAHAEQCLQLSLALIRLLDAMDKERAKKLEDAHEKQRNTLTSTPHSSAP